MKKSIIGYVSAALLAGLVLGYFVFRSSSEHGLMHEHAKESADETLWTCSMHPQILLPEPGSCPICAMDLIPVGSESTYLSPAQFQLSERALALADIQTRKVGSSEASAKGLLLSGRIMENQEANAVQASYFAGRIEQLNVNSTGQSVKKGQLLATIYSPELVAAQQELLTAKSLQTSQPGLYQAVRNKLKLWKLTEGQINAIEASGKVKENFPVYATVAGTVTEKMVQEGDYVMQGQSLFKIANLTTVWGVFDAYEHQLPSLKEGQGVSITTRAYPDKQFDGKITFINPVLNSRSRTVEVRTLLNNSGGSLKPGMFISGIIASAEREGTPLMVPASAVLWTGERSVVYIKADPLKPVFQMREVVIGTPTGDMEQVLSGLHEGEEIVVNGTFTVDAAAQLQGKKSMMNPEGGFTMTGHEGHGGMGVVNTTQGHRSVEATPELLEGLKRQLPTYLKIKDALVNSDNILTSDLASKLRDDLGMLPMASSGDVAKMHIKASVELLESIHRAKDLETQRTLFVSLNEQLIPIFQKTSGNSKTIYIQHCPMANNNAGAFWLSLEEEISNPYYGAAMPGCGEVTDSIQ